MKPTFTNQLIHESSPYLLQHAHNPVNWYPWGDIALEKAKTENKVILVSIGYSACHWCHVMEKESFENETVAKLMNANFINIKIDREERPDLDHIYMDAVQAIAGSGGWPLNVFLTPDAKPFYGGTYFPPAQAFNRPSWTEILSKIVQVWAEQKEDIILQAERLTQHLQTANAFGKIEKKTNAFSLQEQKTGEQVHAVFQNIMEVADKQWGGFGKAPKFPQTFTIQYLLQYYYFTADEKALEQAILSINKMLQGGIYDHVGGGLSRYSTDEQWLVPHFEKMLYDNALFVGLLCDAFQLTNDQQYKKAMLQTLHFVEKEWMNDEGGFYTALDADSEGEEGKYYVWDKKEIATVLGEDFSLFCEIFDITEAGNWEHTNILRIRQNLSSVASEKDMDLGIVEEKINNCLRQLLKKRDTRVKPLLDDKVLLSWNALMITALCKAAAALNEERYINIAQKNFAFLWNNFRVQHDSVELYHVRKNKKDGCPAFLDDYAFLIQACIHLQELTSEPAYLIHARQLTQYVLDHFADDQTAYFFFTSHQQTDAIVRKKEVYDGATASGNSTMASNLYYLGVVFNNTSWQNRAQQMLEALTTAIVSYPTSFAVWASLLLKNSQGIREIIIAGEQYQVKRRELLQHYMPHKVLQCGKKSIPDFPLLQDKNFDSPANIYLCRNHSCRLPVKTVHELLQILN